MMQNCALLPAQSFIRNDFRGLWLFKQNRTLKLKTAERMFFQLKGFDFAGCWLLKVENITIALYFVKGTKVFQYRKPADEDWISTDVRESIRWIVSFVYYV